MSKPEQSKFFGEQTAAGYDKQWQKLAPVRDALQLMLRVRLGSLPDDARVLCVGVGTGSETLYLAEHFPGWTFVLVEPSQPMLDVCRRRMEEHGIAARCTFHDGYLDSLPASAPFDAATCLLVSQFIMQPAARRDLFAEMGQRLSPGGVLVSADLACAAAELNGCSLFETWLEMQRFTGVPEASIENMRTFYRRDVAVSAPQEIEDLIASSGFEAPTLFFQALLIHAWYARKAA